MKGLSLKHGNFKVIQCIYHMTRWLYTRLYIILQDCAKVVRAKSETSKIKGKVKLA